MSAMITGPARFPSRRNEKMNNYYDNAVNEFRAWREKALKSIARRIEEAKPEDQKAEEEWMRVKRMIDEHFYQPIYIISWKRLQETERSI